MVGKRHYEVKFSVSHKKKFQLKLINLKIILKVARLLKDIPTGSTFMMRLVEPLKSGFQTIAPRSGGKQSGKKGYGSGKETLRFKANGKAAIEDEVKKYFTNFFRLES